MNNGTTIQSKHKQQSQLRQFNRRGPRRWTVYVLDVFPFPSSMGGHATFLCSPPQREQMCWKRHGITAHGLPSFQAKHATTRLLFGRVVGPLSEGPWIDLRASPGPEDKRHLVYSAWSSRPNSAFSRDGTCWQKRESYARHQLPLSPPDRTMARYAHRSTALLVGTDNNSGEMAEGPRPFQQVCHRAKFVRRQWFGVLAVQRAPKFHLQVLLRQLSHVDEVPL